MDKVTLDRIAKLHPIVREEMTAIINECNKILTGRSQVRISQGLRTFAEQDALYKQRPKVTNAKGGQSIHNYGFAIDIVLIIDGKVASWDIKKDWDADGVADWDECVKVFAKHGWSWGGSWASFKDMPHFDKIGYNNWRILINKPKDINGYVIV
jgi:peptidoglycan L-alanyl-D-glutamate endopeptidase CwlK